MSKEPNSKRTLNEIRIPIPSNRGRNHGRERRLREAKGAENEGMVKAVSSLIRFVTIYPSHLRHHEQLANLSGLDICHGVATSPYCLNENNAMVGKETEWEATRPRQLKTLCLAVARASTLGTRSFWSQIHAGARSCPQVPRTSLVERKLLCDGRE